VQSQREQGFAKRMFVYIYRIFDDYDDEVVSLAVLADERARWLRRSYWSGCRGFGCATTFWSPSWPTGASGTWVLP
jgi:hypothetical protein